MSTNIVYFNLRLRVAGMYALLTKSNKKKENSNQRGRCQKHSFDKDLSETESCTGEARK